MEIRKFVFKGKEYTYTIEVRERENGYLDARVIMSVGGRNVLVYYPHGAESAIRSIIYREETDYNKRDTTINLKGISIHRWE